MNLLFVLGLGCLAVAAIKHLGLIGSGVLFIILAVLIELW